MTLKILFLTSAHNSMSQRAQVELAARGHLVSVELALSDEVMESAARLWQPDLVVAPMLKKAVPATVWQRIPTLIVHPGIRGDRGASSLDWAIMEGESEWGVTVLQANGEMDAGDIWATEHFPMRSASKSSLYKREVVNTAMKALLLAVDRFERGSFRPEPLDYANPAVRGRLRPTMKQADRAIDWRGTTAEVLRRIHAADGSPGVLDRIGGLEVFLHGGHAEDTLRGAPGQLLATRDGAVCRATGDGAVWITHLRRKPAPGETTFKLPAAAVLGAALAGLPELALHPHDTVAGRTFREIWYEEDGSVGHLHFAFYNGAMSTEQCHRLRDACRYARTRPTKVLVLWGGPDYWSNGIHLNTIEAAANPADESWRNINAIDDVVLEMIETDDRLTIAALQGNAGAGGVMMALAADQVYAARPVVLNPHYKSMGGLYGSEYWTYLLPRRVGEVLARRLTEGMLPISATESMRIGLVDCVFGAGLEDFVAEVRAKAQRLARDPSYAGYLAAKREQRASDEAEKPLAAYRAEELERMRRNFYVERAYHEARREFVCKVTPRATPEHLALHRRRPALSTAEGGDRVPRELGEYELPAHPRTLGEQRVP